MEALGLYYYYTLCAATLAVSLLLRHAIWRGKPKGKANLPPGPRKLPLIGNLHQLICAVGPPRAMKELARRHGPVMLLYFGQVPYVVVSTPEAAAEVTRTNDLLFACRPGSATIDAACGGGLGVIFSPYGEHWRQIRKFCIVEMLSARQVKRLEFIREAEVTSLVRSIATASASASSAPVVNLTEAMSALLNDITARAVFGNGSEVLRRKPAYLRELDRIQTLVGGFNLMDLFPSSRLARSLNTCERDVKKSFDTFEKIMDDIIRERRARGMAAQAGDEEEPLLDVLLRLQKDKDAFSFPLTDEIIRVVISDIFRAAPDTTSTTIEWAMSEFIKNPDVMAKARLEVDRVVSQGQGRTTVTSADTHQFHYLQMVIKETLRVHPAAPLLLRVCLKDCQVMGYDVAEGTNVLVNAYAIATDKKLWGDDAEEFKPERFQNNNTEYYKGTQYEFLPFGAGRRGCPGYLFASATMELTLASLLYHFDWTLPNGGTPSTLDMKDTFGVTLHRASELRLQATPRIHHAC